MRWGSGVVARVLIELLPLLLLLLVSLLLLSRRRRCFGGHCRGARLVGQWKWGLMFSWLVLPAFYL